MSEEGFTVTVLPTTEPKQLNKDAAVTTDPSNLSPTNDGNNVSFVNISYTIQPKKFASLFVQNPPKKILDNVSGSMEPGLNAIMGPSGCGKSSLLDILADRKAKKNLSGHVLINGKRQPHNFKCASAYVVQDDLLMGTLTVRENIAFSAALRLPHSALSRKQRAVKVETVINELGLSDIADSKVGTQLIRGISGGQKKRTSIGTELIISPDIIFLDEPTTGLDASTAVSVVKLLKDLSRSGRVIIMSIHQPRYSIYKLFDSLTLMSRGRIVYHGPAANALNYFFRLGYQCEQHNNPADFFLDVIIENEETHVTKSSNTYSINQDKSVVPAGRLANAYAESKEFFTIKQHLDQKLEVALGEPLRKTAHYATNFFWQCGVVGLRAGRNLIRNRVSTGLQIGMLIGIGIAIGLLFFQLDDDFIGVQNRLGALFFVTVVMGMVNIPAIDVFMQERPLFIHQNVSGYYRVSAYFLGKIFCDVIPLRVASVIFFSAITYWMIGFEQEVDKFLFYMLTLTILSSATASMAIAISARTSVGTVAIMGMAIATLIQVMFSGFLINLNSIGDWIAWMKYISMFRYAFNAIVYNELNGNEYPDNCGSMKNASGFSCLNGDEYLDSLGFSDYDVWYNLVALGAFNVFFLTVAYRNLRVMKKEK